MKKTILICAALAASALSGAQSPYSVNLFQAKVITATSTTTTAIALGSGAAVPKGGSYASGNITLTGSSLTTATFGVTVSADNGVTYFAVPICTVAATPVCAATQTATANAIFTVNLAGITHIKYVTSGTFTATSISLLLTASPNALAGRSGSGSGAPTTCTAGNNYGCLNVANTWSATQTFGTAVATAGFQAQTGSSPTSYGFTGDVGTGFYEPFGAVGIIGVSLGSFHVMALAGNRVNINSAAAVGFTDGDAWPTGLVAGFSYIAHGEMAAGNGTVGDMTARLDLGSAVTTAAAPTVAAGQWGDGATTAAASNCNQSGVLTAVTACRVVNVAGTTRYVPYF